MAGCSSTFVGHPLDTIKVHQQITTTQLSSKSTAVSSSTLQVAKTLASGNVFRLFKGIGPPMANQIMMNTVMFSVFHKVKDWTNNTNSMLVGGNENASAMCAGLLSGFATACLSTPTDWIKIQAQLGKKGGTGTGIDSSSSSLSIVRRLLHDNQYQAVKVTRTLYRGHVANLAREGVFTMVYLGLYDRISSKMKDQQQQQLSMGQVMMISSFTGACAWICNYPVDTLKTVIQGRSMDNRVSMGDAFRSIWESGGVKAFYRGVTASTGRAMLVTSIRMLAYESTIQWLNP